MYIQSMYVCTSLGMYDIVSSASSEDEHASMQIFVINAAHIHLLYAMFNSYAWVTSLTLSFQDDSI